MASNAIVEGYMENNQGHLVPKETIQEVDLARNDLVLELMDKAQTIAQALSIFKSSSLDDIQAFVELSSEKYGAKLGGNRGNVTLFSYDGRYKLVRSTDDFIRFDERLHAAKALIDDCLKRWSEGSGVEIRTIVNDAFQVDKAGRINTRKILGLRRIKIEDEDWRQAMAAISDSVQVINSKTYIRFYQRQLDGSYQQLNLSIAA